MTSETTRYLTISELIYINGTVLNNPQILSGKQQIRDIALLEAAAARPSSSAFGQDAYPTLPEKVAALCHSIARNHPFTDGNKRTATVAAVFMLKVNGFNVVWNQEEALSTIVSMAEGRRDVASFAEWLPIIQAHNALEPDEQQDMALIDNVIDEQRWLLDELAKQ
jgi:death on curing protein